MPLEESPHEALTEEHRLLQHATALLTIGVEALLVLGNLLPPLVVFRAKSSAERTNLDLIVAALSVTDILSVLVPEPPWIVAYFRGTWQRDARACNLHQLTALWLQLASMFIVVLLVLDRARCARRMLEEPMPLPVDTRNSVLLGCLLLTCYCLTLLTATLPLLGFAPSAVADTSGPDGELVSGFCVSWLARRPVGFKESVFFVVFAAVAGLCVASVLGTNLVIICLWQRKQVAAQKAAEQEDPAASAADLLIEEEQYHEMGRFIQTMRVTALISLVFCCTWIPTLVLAGLRYANLSVSPPLVMYAQLSTTLSGVFNPLIYAVCSHSYREGYLRVFCGCCCCCRRCRWWCFRCCIGGGGGGGRTALGSSDDDPIDLPVSSAIAAAASAAGYPSLSSPAGGLPRDQTVHSLLPHSASQFSGITCPTAAPRPAVGAASAAFVPAASSSDADAAGACYAQLGPQSDCEDRHAAEEKMTVADGLKAHGNKLMEDTQIV